MGRRTSVRVGKKASKALSARQVSKAVKSIASSVLAQRKGGRTTSLRVALLASPVLRQGGRFSSISGSAVSQRDRERTNRPATNRFRRIKLILKKRN